jgi:2'-5' RNA ligase
MASDVDRPTRRLLVGLMADASVQFQISEYRRLWHWPPGAGESPAPNLHLTLHFLGDVDQQKELALREAIRIMNITPMKLRFETAEVWPGGIAVLRPNENVALSQLRRNVEDAMRVAKLMPDTRPFEPHVTLAYNAMGAVPPTEPVSIGWNASAVSLVWLRSRAAGYSVVLERWPPIPR